MIRDAVPADFDAILRLNAQAEHFMSPVSPARLAQLHGWSAYHRVAETEAGVAAFLLAFREGSDYDSPNYRWFARRFARFLYIDRIAVVETHRGQGWGKALYEDLFAFALGCQVERVTCEFDVDPPNPVSERFHRRFGFEEVGRQRYGTANKLVALQCAFSATT